jgi:hypothetical protein
MTDRFNVYQFFEDGTYEQVRTNVDGEEAVKAAHHYCNSVAAKCGVTRRVIITDSGDCTNFEWKYGEGVVFPEPQKGETSAENQA